MSGAASAGRCCYASSDEWTLEVVIGKRLGVALALVVASLGVFVWRVGPTSTAIHVLQQADSAGGAAGSGDGDEVHWQASAFHLEGPGSAALRAFLNPRIRTSEYKEVELYLFQPDGMQSSKRGQDRFGHDFWKFLQSHPARTTNMSRASLFVGMCNPWSYPERSDCIYEAPMNAKNFGDVSRRRLHLQLDSFHDLKRSGQVRPDAWLVIVDWRWGPTSWPYLAHSNYSDLSIVSTDGVAGGGMGVRGLNDVSYAVCAHTWCDSKQHFIPHGTEERMCEARDKKFAPINRTLFAYFQGTVNIKWYDLKLLDFRGQDLTDSDGMFAYRLRDLRGSMHKRLDNSEALSRGIVFYGKPRGGQYKPTARGINFTEAMSQARFCFTPAGNFDWSYRFFEALEAGCIPVMISGGYLMPYSPAIQWRDLVVRVSELFDWSNITRLEEILLWKPRLEKFGSFCAWHHALQRVWESVKNGNNHFELILASLRLRFLQTRDPTTTFRDYFDTY